MTESDYSDLSDWLRTELVASWREIIVVLALLLGPFACRSGWAALQGSSSHYIAILMSQSLLLMNGAIESLLLALFLGFLHRRGWKSADFKIKPNGWSSLQAIPLYIASILGNVFVFKGALVFLFFLELQYADFPSFENSYLSHLKSHSVEVYWSVLIGAMILNAFFEEIICTGYAFNQFAAKLGPRLALPLIVLLRMSCHTYQGPAHMMGVGTIFLIYGLWYWWTRNLWTLIFAHALLDIVALLISA